MPGGYPLRLQPATYRSLNSVYEQDDPFKQKCMGCSELFDAEGVAD
jgi:hypothetical protein